MLTLDNDVRIIDFGIALVKDSDVSRIEGIAGSPSYMSPEQVQSAEITPRSDIYSLGAVMYELLTGFRPFRANNLSKLLHQIVYATPPPIHTLRDGIPEELEQVVVTALQKDPEDRFKNGLEFAAALTQALPDSCATRTTGSTGRSNSICCGSCGSSTISRTRRSGRFCARASGATYQSGDEIIREGEIDDRFYIIVNGTVSVQSGRRQIGALSDGDCFGETSYVRGARRTATISATSPVTLVRVSSTLLEQASSSAQLRFNKVFLRSLIERLQGVAPSAT